MIRRAAHVLALSSLAVAQPLYDLLGRNPEFFAAHGASRAEIVAFALVLLLGPPAVLVAVELAAGTVRERLGEAVHVAFVGILAGLLALQATGRLAVPGGVALALAGAAAVAASAAYVALAPVRAFLTVLAAAPAVFLALFLVFSPVASLVRTGEARAEVARIDAARAPVVVVVLDELPLNSLLDERGRIDAVRFPAFAALARRADWFPNATAVHEGTLWAVPAILTGRVPVPRQLPRFEHHRRNLFTLLGGRYRVEAIEGGTRLCPATVCRDRDGAFASLLEDTSVVYAHTVLPADLAKKLPPVNEGWGGFLGEAGDEAGRFSDFVDALEPSPAPRLSYGHFLLPHSPWRHLPSGETYELRPPAALWGRDEVWTDDEALVAQSFQRHLFQTAYGDALLGRLVARLEATGLLDRALVVVVADHGISFRPGGKRRPVTRTNLADIAFVPLLLKRPGQRSGRVLRRHVRTVDVLPTIADLLGVDVPWPLAGRSAYAPGPGAAEVAVRKDGGEEVSLPLADAVRLRRAALARQVSLFGSGTPAARLFGVGPHRGMLEGRGAFGDHAEVDFEQRAARGLLALGGRAPDEARSVAVVAGGAVVAVAPVFAGRFWALVPTETDDVRATVVVSDTEE